MKKTVFHFTKTKSFILCQKNFKKFQIQKRLLTLEIQCCCEVKKDPRRIIELFLFRIGSCLRQ